MKINNVSFSKQGWEKFVKMTRTQQKEKLKNADKTMSDKEIDNLLKNVSYGKSEKSKSKTKKGNTKPASNRGGGTGGAVKGTEGSQD